MLQDLDSESLPEQVLPPWLGDGQVQLLAHNCDPPPHVLEQLPELTQPHQPPLTGDAT